MKKVAAVVGMLILIGVMLAAWWPGGGAVGSEPERARVASPHVSASAVPPTMLGRSPSVAHPRLAVTADGDAYAPAIAGVLFGMDTRTVAPDVYRASLLDQADLQLSATGYADLERLLAERIPSDGQWARMRANAQWSTFEPTDVWEPGSWTQVVIAGQAEPGWVVRNVTGVQTTHYTEAGVEKAAVRERSVTIGMRCPAPGAGVDSCRLVLVGGSVLP